MPEGRIQIIKYAPPPPELPIYGRVDDKEVSFFGRTNYVAALEEKKFIFGIKRADRRRHMYVVGKSGVGKSKFLELLIRQDIAFGHGLCLIDPHGELIDAILDFVPEERAEDIVYIDPADLDHPIAWNPLAEVSEHFAHDLVQGLVEIMAKQFDSNWTPKLEHVFRFACLTLIHYPGATLRDIIPLLTDEEYRAKVISGITDELMGRFWTVEFPDIQVKFHSESLAPLINKMSQLFSNPMLRGIFSAHENRLDFAKLMAEKKIILVSLSRGHMGDEAASFFGSLLILKLKQAAMAQTKKSEDFYLYADEFELLATHTFQYLLTQGLKSGLCLTLSHQYGSQLPQNFLAAISGSVGTLVVFRVGGEDAQRLKSEMAPVFDPKDMMNLGTREFYIKMVIDGEPYDPFSAETLKVMPAPYASLKEKIIAFSQKNYGLSK